MGLIQLPGHSVYSFYITAASPQGARLVPPSTHAHRATMISSSVRVVEFGSGSRHVGADETVPDRVPQTHQMLTSPTIVNVIGHVKDAPYARTLQQFAHGDGSLWIFWRFIELKLRPFRDVTMTTCSRFNDDLGRQYEDVEIIGSKPTPSNRRVVGSPTDELDQRLGEL
ncbi:hypothetical protein BT69DRAFT_1285984 [Atractiella rhizophila]|nr:hypothetical protein BT69DRAFT_1285984 [Atractiella rhizophila]